eukprot:5859904-Pyramimonas_sp.AAC.1
MYHGRGRNTHHERDGRPASQRLLDGSRKAGQLHTRGERSIVKASSETTSVNTRSLAEPREGESEVVVIIAAGGLQVRCHDLRLVAGWHKEME